MKRAVYPVEYDPLLRVFNNQLSFYQFLAQYNPEINVGLSALLPPTEFVIGSVHYPCRTIVDFFEKIARFDYDELNQVVENGYLIEEDENWEITKWYSDNV